MNTKKFISVMLVATVGVSLFAFANSYASSTSPSVADSIKNLPTKERATRKGKAISQIGHLTKVRHGDYYIEIQKMNPIEGGVEVFARAWDKGDNQIGFGKDGSVDIERFRFFNPPIMVPDGTKSSNIDETTGTAFWVDNFKEDLISALLISLEHAILVKKEKFDERSIEKGKEGHTTDIFYPSDSAEDGYVAAGGSPTSFSALRSSGGFPPITYSYNGEYGAFSLRASAAANQFAVLYRSIFQFDTSAISDTDVLSSATFSVYGVRDSESSFGGSLKIDKPSPASHTSLQDSDYYLSSWAGIAQSDTSLNLSAFNAHGYNDFDLNSVGIANISKTNFTSLGIRFSWDFDNVEPTWVGGEIADSYMVYLSEQVGTTNDPQLVIEHTAPSPVVAVPKNFIANLVSTSSISLGWIDNATNENGYQLERSLDGTTYAQIATTSANAVSYLDGGLSPATTYYYRLRAFNAGGGSEYATTSAITEVENHAPVLSSIGSQSVSEGETLALTLSVIDPDGDSLTYDATNLPPGAMFDAQTHVFSWTPTFTQSGVYFDVVFTVTDTGNPTLSDTESITITVDNVNRAPVFSPIGNQVVSEGGTLALTLSAIDPDGDNLTYSAANLPQGAMFDAQTRTFSWVPNYSQAGNYPNIEFTVTDNGSPIELAVELITITVGDVNRAPVFAPIGAQQVVENTPLSFVVSATDPDGDIISLIATSVPSGVAFNAMTGLFSWTPGLTQAGVYVVTFVATDNGAPIEYAIFDMVITVGDNPTPVEQAAVIVNVVVDYGFSTNIENSYLANLKKVESFIQNGQVTSAIKQLIALVAKVNADYGRGVITLAMRDDLLARADLLIAVLNN